MGLHIFDLIGCDHRVLGPDIVAGLELDSLS
jgi:hypothetical protein